MNTIHNQTDHDLTGQIVWPASLLLSWFIHSKIGRDSFENETVLELGAGCGLAGNELKYFIKEDFIFLGFAAALYW